MDNRVSDINAILKDLFIGARSFDIDFTESSVYDYLIRRDVPKSDLDKNINFEHDYSETEKNSNNNFFGRWIAKFNKKNSNIEVYCAENWKYFCQFNNRSDLVIPDKCIKIYIPLDYNHIYEGVNRIFTFLSKNDITHTSKVSSKIRFDDVVVRLTNIEDARRLQEFIDNDKYIQSGLIKSTAFGFNKNGVGYAYDGYLSYNSYVSAVVADYINNMKKNPNIVVDDINFTSFYSYVDSISRDSQKIESFNVGSAIKNLRLKSESAHCIIQLFKKSLVSNDIRDYEQFFGLVSNTTTRKNFMNISSEVDDKKGLIDELILTTMKKYPLGYDSNNPNLSGWDYISNFVFKNNINGVTRDNNLRSRVMECGLNGSDFFAHVCNSGIMGYNGIDKFNNYIKMVMLNDMIKSLSIRFGSLSQAITNIKAFINSNDFHLITGSVGDARSLAFTLQANDIRKFFQDLGVVDVEDYVNQYYNVNSRKYERR